jgi:hypothetical protein
LNELCVTRAGKAGGLKKDVEWPKDHKLYRGGGLPNEHQGVWNEEREREGVRGEKERERERERD